MVEAGGQDGFLEARPFAFEVLRGEIGVAEGLQQLDGGVLAEVELIPAALGVMPIQCPG